MNHTDTDLIGTWFISGSGFDEDGILVLRTDGICIQFLSSISRPLNSQTLRLWYSCPDEDTLQFKMKPDGKEGLRHIRQIERTATGWTMVYSDEHGRKEFPCRIAKPDELPDWFQEMMDKNLVKMAALASKDSTAEQASTSNGG
jgi:hypothetical protein